MNKKLLALLLLAPGAALFAAADNQALMRDRLAYFQAQARQAAADYAARLATIDATPLMENLEQARQKASHANAYRIKNIEEAMDRATSTRSMQSIFRNSAQARNIWTRAKAQIARQALPLPEAPVRRRLFFGN